MLLSNTSALFSSQPQIMTRFGNTFLVLLVTTVATSTAFIPTILPHHTRLSAVINEDEVDYDAPITKAAKPLTLDHDIIVADDECYLGKYGQYEECVDFGT